MAGSPPAIVYPQGRGVGAPTASLLGRACECAPRILGGQKNPDGAIGAARLDAADQRFLAGIFIGVGETLAVAGDEI